MSLEERELRAADADRARYLVESALDPRSALRARNGAERLLAAARVYAILATTPIEP